MFMPKFVKEEQKLKAEFIKTHPAAFSKLAYDHRSIHFAQLGTRQKPKIIFVHGSPGEWSHFVRQLNDENLQKKAFLISADRLGYGGSDQGKPERSLDQQAQSLLKLLELDDPQQSVILVGHSLGGPIVARMAMLQDPRIKSIILLGASVDPNLEETKWYQYVAELGIFRWLVPTDLVTCNREILALKNELIRIELDWKKIKARVIVLQGLKDTLVDPRNADYIQTHAPKAEITRLPDAGHIVTAFNQDEVMKLILKELDRL